MNQEIIRIDLEGVNCYLGKEGDSFILFDTGGHLSMDKEFSNRRERLEKALEKAGCLPGRLKLVVLTHGDNDHAANAAYIREKYGTGIAMHSGDMELVENPTVDKLMESFRYKSLIYKLVFLFVKKLLRNVTVKTLNEFEKFRPDILLNNNDSLSSYGFGAKVLHIPGHTAGSIAVLTEDGDLIAGDTFINAKKPDTAPNACDFKALAASAARVRAMDLKMIYPGHGEPFEALLLK